MDTQLGLGHSMGYLESATHLHLDRVPKARFFLDTVLDTVYNYYFTKETT